MTPKLLAAWKRHVKAGEKLNGLPADATPETRATVQVEFNTATAEVRGPLRTWSRLPRLQLRVAPKSLTCPNTFAPFPVGNG